MIDRVSPHFTRSEFSCKCGCGFNAVDTSLLEILEKVRTHFDSPTTITSANRCLEHNRNIGSKDTSQHVRGLASDIKVKGHSPQEVYDYLEDSVEPGGLGIYKTWVHVDVRSGDKKRWDSRYA